MIQTACTSPGMAPPGRPAGAPGAGPRPGAPGAFSEHIDDARRHADTPQASPEAAEPGHTPSDAPGDQETANPPDSATTPLLPHPPALPAELPFPKVAKPGNPAGAPDDAATAPPARASASAIPSDEVPLPVDASGSEAESAPPRPASPLTPLPATTGGSGNVAGLPPGGGPAAIGTIQNGPPTGSHAAPTPPIHVGSIGTPLADPGFPGQLAGDTVSLALTGIERAEISLRPRDMGPIRLELALNGESARIAFSAVQPDTRQAIERSLPLLASMLAEHGLLLADASVSDQPARDEHAGGRAPESRSPSGGPGAAGASGNSQGPVRIGRGAPRGLLDLYA